MSFSELGVVDYLLAIIFVWLLILSFYFIKTSGRYSRVAKEAGGANLSRILESIAAKNNLQAKQIKELSESLAKMQTAQKTFFQKHALIRFNPFEDTGGDQSFVFSILDGVDNGVVVTSLHSRGGTRIYAKQVLGGKTAGQSFSKEEREAIEKARPL